MRKSIFETATDIDEDEATGLERFDAVIVAALESNPLFLDEPIEPSEASKLLKVTVGTLANQRNKGTGPRYNKIGSSIRYTRRGCLEYLAAG